MRYAIRHMITQTIHTEREIKRATASLINCPPEQLINFRIAENGNAIALNGALQKFVFTPEQIAAELTRLAEARLPVSHTRDASTAPPAGQVTENDWAMRAINKIAQSTPAGQWPDGEEPEDLTRPQPDNDFDRIRNLPKRKHPGPRKNV